MGFNWIIDNQLAGSGRPGLYCEAEEDLAFILEHDIHVVVNLTETQLGDEFTRHQELEVIHFPIPDMGIPLPNQAHPICVDIKRRMDEGENVLIHCKAGLGRTGTILACVLVELGYQPEEAITEVRKNIRMAIQNSLQENFIQHYFNYSRSQGGSD